MTREKTNHKRIVGVAAAFVTWGLACLYAVSPNVRGCVERNVGYWFNKPRVQASQRDVPASQPASRPVELPPYHDAVPDEVQQENDYEASSTRPTTRPSQERTILVRNISQDGLNAIANHEGLRLNVYNDVAGNPTIGYGRLIRGEENYTQITREQALDLLRQDVASAENAVRNNIRVNLTQNQYDALVSLAYNIGNNAFGNSTLVRRVNQRDYGEARNEFGRWVHAGGRRVQGLVNRRQAEAERFGN